MKFEGVVGACELPDIFHLLSSSGRQGILMISKGDARRQVYFDREGVTLLFEASRFDRLLGQILLARGAISEGDLKSALERQRTSRRPLGEVLRNLGATRPDDVKDALTYQLREELFSLLTWENATFEFLEDTPRPAGSGRSYLRTPSFNPDAIIMEAARRADEWPRIRSLIGSPDSVLLRLSDTPPFNGEIEVGEAASSLLELADGTQSIGQMAELLGRSEFEVCEAACTLLRSGLAKLADAEQLADLAAISLETGEMHHARRLLAAIAPMCGDNVERHYDVGTLLLWAGLEEEAAKHLDTVLGRLVEKKLTNKIDQMLDALSEEFPDVPYSYERRLRLLDPATDFDRAFPLARHLLELYNLRDAKDKAHRMLKHLGKFNVTRTEDLLKLGEMLESQGELKTASRRYYLAAQQLGFSIGRHGAIPIYRRALRLDSRLTAARREMNRLLETPGRLRKRSIAVAAVLLTVLTLAAALTFLVHRERRAEQVLEKVRASAEDLLARGDYDGAITTYGAFLSKQRYSAAAARVRRRIEEIERKQQAHLAARGYTADKLLASAVEAEKQLDLDGAIAEYRRLATLVPGEETARQAEANLHRLIAEKNGFEQHLVRARTLEAAGRCTEALGSYLAARDCSQRLFDREQVKLPLSVESRPSGAEVLSNGTLLGRTPLVLHHRFNEAVKVVLRREGHFDTPLEVPACTTEAVARAELIPRRLPLWTFPGSGAVDGSPQIVGTACYFSSREGRLYAVELLTGRKLWQRRLNTTPGQYVSAPLPVEGRLLVATMDGTLQAFAPETGRELWRRDGHGLVAGPPMHFASSRVVVIVHADGTAYWVSPQTGDTVRTQKLPHGVVGDVRIVGDVLYYGTTDHALQAFDLKSGRVVWKLRPGLRVTQAMACSDDVLYVPLGDSRLAAVSRREGKVVWRFDAQGLSITPPVVDGAHVFVGTREGTLFALNARSGRVLWRVRTDRAANVAPVTDTEHVYLGTADGKLSVFKKTDGALLWKCELVGQLAAPPIVTGSRMLVSTTQGAVHAFER